MMHELTLAAKEIAGAVLNNLPEHVVLLHHNDTDGLTAGAILAATFERLHLPIFRYCLEKPYPTALKQIFENPLLERRTMVVFADFGSGMLPEIARINAGRHTVLLIDHHTINNCDDTSLLRLHCIDHGIDGSTECSASSLAYLFATAVAAYNEDLQILALLGGAGDRHFESYDTATGVHAALYAEALQKKTIDAAGMCLQRHEGTLETLRGSIDALGSFGYFSGGTDIALKGLLDGFDARYHMYARQYQAQYNDALQEFLAETQLQHAGRLCWFVLPERFLAFGVKTVGLVCEYLAESKIDCFDQYILGFQSVPNQIPGMGTIELNQVKFSMRVGKKIRQRVIAEELPTIRDIIADLARVENLFVDACHKHAGAATCVPGAEEKVVAELKKLLA